MNLVPEGKHDIDTAQAAVYAGYPNVEPVLDELTEWLQDYNWPVAGILAPFLASIGKPMIPRIDHVFSTDDNIWKYWMIVCLIEKNDELFEHYKETLERIALRPSEEEKREELDEVSREALEEHGVNI